MSIEADTRNLAKWLNEEQAVPIDRQALARILAHMQASQQSLNHSTEAYRALREAMSRSHGVAKAIQNQAKNHWAPVMGKSAESRINTGLPCGPLARTRA